MVMARPRLTPEERMARDLRVYRDCCARQKKDLKTLTDNAFRLELQVSHRDNVIAGLKKRLSTKLQKTIERLEAENLALRARLATQGEEFEPEEAIYWLNSLGYDVSQRQEPALYRAVIMTRGNSK